MQYYFAPLEGITGYLYRNIHHKHFPGIDRYYSPFVVTRDGGIMKRKELRDILPENKRGYVDPADPYQSCREFFVRCRDNV